MANVWNLLRYFLKFMVFFITNLYALPCYIIWMTLLTPLRIFAPNVYWKLESFMFHMLQCMIITWIDTGGYKILECGDDITKLQDSRAIILCNHQSTADTPVVMLASYNKGNAAGNTMWIMYVLFKYTNFGLVSWHREDFFIDQGKNVRESQLMKLKDHLIKSYKPCNRKWIIVFPEGGFLHKRLESSQNYARKNNHPVLQHVTLPRTGAIKCILDTLGEPERADREDSHVTSSSGDDWHKKNEQSDQIEESSEDLEWIVDITLAYKDAKPLDMFGMCVGYCPRNEILLHYRAYRVKDIPREEAKLTKWLYQRYAEKDAILDHYYKEGQLSEEVLNEQRVLPPMPPSYLRFDLLQQILIHAFIIVSCYLHYVYIVKPIFAVFSWLLSFIF